MNSATERVEKLRMNSALTPVAAASLMYETLQDIGASPVPRLESGGEDLPNAFRAIPIREDHLRYNVVGTKNPKTAEVRYFVILAALFGYESAVYSFGRYSAFF